MSEPVITFASNFAPNRTTPLAEIFGVRGHAPLIKSSFVQDTNKILYTQPGILTPLVVNGAVSSTWFIDTDGEVQPATVLPGVTIGGTIHAITDASNYIYPGCQYRLYIISTMIGQRVTTEMSCTVTMAESVVTKSFTSRDGEDVDYLGTSTKMFYMDFQATSPVVNIDISSPIPSLGTEPAGPFIHNVYLVSTDLLYSDRSIGSQQVFYQYQALWNHLPATSSPTKLTGPYGETIPDTEYKLEYSQTPYETFPRYTASHVWGDSVETTTCAIRILLSDRLLQSYAEKPLYLTYNKTLAGKTHYGFIELVDAQRLSPLPWSISHTRLLDYGGLRSGWSGYYLRALRPKMNFIFQPDMVEGSYPDCLNHLYYITPEHRQQPSYRGTDNTKVSWERPALINNTTMNIDDGIVVKRREYPDNSVVVLRDRDPYKGVRYPTGWGWKCGSSEDGTILVSVNDRGLASESIIGIDSKHGLVVCGENLDSKDVWVSYQRDKSWWTFDRPYLSGVSGLNPVNSITVGLLATWSYVVAPGSSYTFSQDGSNDIVDILASSIVKPASVSVEDVISTAGLKLIVYGHTAPTSYTPVAAPTVQADGSIRMLFTRDSIATAIAGRSIACVTTLDESSKTLYGTQSGETTTWATARIPVGTEMTFDDTYLSLFPRISIGSYQIPFDTTADYKVEEVAISGGGLLPDNNYKTSQLQTVFPFYNHFADIGRWYPLQYQADSTMVASVRSDWLQYMTNSLDGQLRPVTCLGDAEHQLTDWVLHGVTASNSDSYTLYWSFTATPTVSTVRLYSDSAKLIVVAEGSCSPILGTITFSAVGSGITGSVQVLKHTVDDTDSGNTITVPEDTTREKTLALVKDTINKYCSYGAFVDVITAPYSRVLTSIGHGEAIAASAGPDDNNVYIILDSLITMPILTQANGASIVEP